MFTGFDTAVFCTLMSAVLVNAVTTTNHMTVSSTADSTNEVRLGNPFNMTCDYADLKSDLGEPSVCIHCATFHVSLYLKTKSLYLILHTSPLTVLK